MIAAAKQCGCLIKPDFQTSPKENASTRETTFQQSFSLLDSRKDLEKCICPRPNEPGYQKMNGTCDICCKGGTEFKNEDIKEDVIKENRSKVVSEIVERGLPYKEIEAIINNNRMVIRVQKDSTSRHEWDPPCDCIEESEKPVSQQYQNINKNRNDVIFRKVDQSQYSQNPCRTITVYPQADSEVNPELNPNKNQKANEIEPRMMDMKELVLPESEKKNQQQQKSIVTSIDHEENPNIFLLRIKKRCESTDGKYNIDLEFRAPRPWLPKPVDKKPPPPPVEAAETKIEDKKGGSKKGKKGKKGKK